VVPDSAATDKKRAVKAWSFIIRAKKAERKVKIKKERVFEGERTRG
jgi:hypothetical protein